MKHIYLKVLLYAYTISTFSLGIVAPIYTFLVQKIGGGILETAWSIALFSIVTGLVTIGVYQTSWSQQYRKELLVGGWFLWLVSLLMYCGMNSLHLLFLSQLVGGFGSALSSAAFDAEYSEIARNDALKAWALFEGATSITSGIASVIAGCVAHYYGLDTLMICMSLVATLSFILIFYYAYILKKRAPAESV